MSVGAEIGWKPGCCGGCLTLGVGRGGGFPRSGPPLDGTGGGGIRVREALGLGAGGGAGVWLGAEAELGPGPGVGGDGAGDDACVGAGSIDEGSGVGAGVCSIIGAWAGFVTNSGEEIGNSSSL